MKVFRTRTVSYILTADQITLMWRNFKWWTKMTQTKVIFKVNIPFMTGMIDRIDVFKILFFNSKYQDYPFGNQIVLSNSYYGLYDIWWYSIIHVHEVSTLKQTFRTFETVKLDRPKWKCRYFSRWKIHFRIQKIVQT